MSLKTDLEGKSNDSVENFDALVPDRQARAELGDLSAMSFWRYDRHPEKAPAGWGPPLKLGGRNYRSRRMLERVKANLVQAAQERGRAKVRIAADEVSP
jgi:hypothetical protein